MTEEAFQAALTDTRASVTLVRTAGRNECTKILCSVTARTSRLTAFLGPRFSSNVERLPPLMENTKREEQIHVPRNMLQLVSYT